MSKLFRCERCSCSGVTVECCIRRQRKATSKRAADRKYPECTDCAQGLMVINYNPDVVKAMKNTEPKKPDYSSMHAARREARETYTDKMDSLKQHSIEHMEEL